ncbi:MAG: response regulator [Candidatus Saccharimonadaceae bacterium]
MLQIFLSCNLNADPSIDEAFSQQLSIKEFEQQVAQVKDLNNRGTTARNIANYKEALNLHFQALNLAEAAKDTVGQIYALNNLGTDLRRTYSNLEASTYHYLALEFSASNKKHSKTRALAMNGLGNIFLSLNKHKQAKSYFQRALAIEQELKSNLGIAINYANLAETYSMSNDLDSALYYYNESLKQNKLIDSNIGEAICKRAMGIIYYKKQNIAFALQLLNEAFIIMKDSKDAFHKLEVQISLAGTLIEINKIDEAEPHVMEILSLSKAVNSYEYQQRAYELLAKLKEKQQLYRPAYDAKENAFLYRDSVMAQNSEVRIIELENRYKGKEAAQQIQLLTTENALTEKNKADQQRIFFLLILLLSVFIGFLYYRYHHGLKLSRELEKVNEMKSKFFSNVSHEFRTPLTLIKGPLENWLDSDLSPELRKDATMMLRNSDRLLFLVDQLLSLSKVDSGNFKITPQKANISMMLKGISNFYIYFANEKSIKYNIDIQDSGISWVDSQIVEIIVNNLLSNALKFTENNGCVSFKGESKGDSYMIQVSNSGKRLSNDQLSKIFERFYTDGPTDHSGTGIGLSLVDELCALYQATLSVGYNDKNEIEFTVILPPLQMQEDKELSDLALDQVNVDRFHPVPDIKIESTSNGKNETVDKDEIVFSDLPLLLVVEDNDDLRKYVVVCFKDSFRTLEAKDGEEGIALAQEHIPDIIISDIMMPKVDGLELCNTLKADVKTNHIPIILLTALNEERDLIAGLKSKADDYVIKPFAAKMLKQKVENLIEVRKVLGEKYRKEILLKPLDLLLPNGEDRFAIILKEVLDNEITNPEFGVDEFCKVAGMSRAQLYRKLKATVDMSVSEFIRVHRVKLASELLKNRNLNVTDVCYASGFNDTSYFSKSFKDVFKVPPAEYRKRWNRNP